MAEDSVEVSKALVTSITHATAKGFTVRPIDPVTHRFVKKPTKKASAEEIARINRDFLNARIEIGPDGKPTRSTKTRYMQQLEIMHEHIINSKGTKDPKMVMAAQSTFKTLAERAWGPARDVDVEEQTSGVKIVIVTAPELPNQGELQERAQLKPSFAAPRIIDAEIVE